MKLPIIVKNTSYLEFETPCYYEDRFGRFFKFYDTGYVTVNTNSIFNHFINLDKPDEYLIKEVREVLETGKPITEQEFINQFTITVNHISILCS